MKAIFLLLCAALAVNMKAQQPLIESSKYGWEYMPQLSDEFNGTSLDQSKWYDYDPRVGVSIDNKATIFMANNVQVGTSTYGNSSNVLKLIAKKGSVLHNSFEHHYQSGAVMLKPKVYNGYFEIRARIPNSKNSNGTAFWLWNAEAIGPNSTVYSELDVFETNPINPRLYTSAVHSGSNTDPYAYNGQPVCEPLTMDITEDFHVYGIDWGEDKIECYIDGKLVNTYNNLISYYNLNTTLPPGVLREMGLIIWNKGNLGIEPSIAGDVMEIDYIRCFKRKPRISLNSYDANLNQWTYLATGINQKDIVSETHSDVNIINVLQANDKCWVTLKITGNNPQLKFKTTQTISRFYFDPLPTFPISAESTVDVGKDNPEFYYETPYFSSGYLSIKCYAVSQNPNGEWRIGVENAAGIVNWAATTPQWGNSVTFNGLLSGKKYQILHGVYEANVPWNGLAKAIDLKYDPSFFINKMIWQTNGDKVKLAVLQKSTNPDSEWHIGKVISINNNVVTLDNSIDQPQWGHSATFQNLVRGQTYQISHGNYGVNQPWIGTAKLVKADLNSNFELYNPYHPSTTCWGTDDKGLTRDVNGNINLKVSPYDNNFYSEYTLAKLDIKGNYIIPAVQGPISGQAVTFNNLELYNPGLDPNKPINYGYMVMHKVRNSSTAAFINTKRAFRVYEENIMPAFNPNQKNVFMDDADNNNFNLSITKNSILGVYPNPTNGELIIDFIGEYTIMNLQGQTVAHGVVNGKTNLNLSKLSKGFYIVTVRNDLTSSAYKVSLIE
jgi:beta-glucanase (GH16 family)